METYEKELTKRYLEEISKYLDIGCYVSAKKTLNALIFDLRLFRQNLPEVEKQEKT